MFGFNSSGKLVICEKLESVKLSLSKLLVASVTALSFGKVPDNSLLFPVRKANSNVCLGHNGDKKLS